LNNKATYTLDSASNLSENKLMRLNFFWAGFIIYTLAYVVKSTGHVNQRLCEMTQFIGVIVFLPSAIYLIHNKIKNRYLSTIFTIYCISTLFVIFRGVQFNYDSIKSLIVDSGYGMFLYLVPAILLFPQNLKFYKKIFDVIVVLSIFFFICDGLFIRDLLDRSPETQDIIELFTWNLALPSGFILLTYKYHSNKRKLLSLAAIVLALLFSIYKARRGLSLILSSVLIFSFFVYLFSTKQKVLIIYLTALLICLGFLYATSIYNITNNKLLNFIAQRGDEDTRTGVELYFYNDMHSKDWIFGRGINGKYYCPGIIDDPNIVYRSLIETGYLQIILKGGLIRLILFLLIAVPAAFLGLFSSKNLLSKASAIWIIIALIAMYPATVESFTFEYMILWIAIGICYSKNIRNLENNFIKERLQNIGNQI
jgi:hypothetical protein